MADYTVNINTYWDREMGYFVSTSPASTSMNVGDRIRFRHVCTASTPTYMSVYMVTNSWFTPNSTDATLSHNEYSSYYTSTTSGTIGIQFRAKYYYYGYSNYYTHNVTSAVPYVQYTGTRNLQGIGLFFGDTAPFLMSQYYRGGVYVRQLDGRNNGVPGAGPLSLNDLNGVWK
jgi:hypothetical protein